MKDRHNLPNHGIVIAVKARQIIATQRVGHGVHQTAVGKSAGPLGQVPSCSIILGRSLLAISARAIATPSQYPSEITLRIKAPCW